jgi:hypothetical protein
MVKRVGLGLLWLGFATYAFCFAPPDQPDTLQLIQNLSIGNWQGINPLITVLFNLMGIWPMIYACLLCSEGRSQAVPVWPFVLGSFFLGAFALLPYLVFRNAEPEWYGQPNRIVAGLSARWMGGLLSLAAIALLTYGVSQGNWPDFVQQWQTSRFIHVMSLDFCLLSGLFPILLGDDMARRGWQNAGWYWAIALIPLLGALVYLCVRPPLTPTSVLTAPTPDRQVAPHIRSGQR